MRLKVEDWSIIVVVVVKKQPCELQRNAGSANGSAINNDRVRTATGVRGGGTRCFLAGHT